MVNFFDGVINGYLEPEMFAKGSGSGDYYFYIGRMIERKGFRIAQEVCERLGKRLIWQVQVMKEAPVTASS